MRTKAILLIVAVAMATAVAQRGGTGPGGGPAGQGCMGQGGMGQGGMGQGPGFKYDPSTETRLNGSIEEINTRGGGMGTHLVVKTNQGNVEVALGPSRFLKDQSLQLNKGDRIEVTGAKTTTRRGEMFIARQITSAGKTVTLRDEKGVPAWSNGMCR